MDFKDKVVVITGGSQGIGKKTAEMFKELGAHVCLIDLKMNIFKGILVIKIHLFNLLIK